MILTDIYIPAVDANYDFMLDENVPAVQVMEEISEMISKKVKEKSRGRSQILCCMRWIPGRCWIRT